MQLKSSQGDIRCFIRQGKTHHLAILSLMGLNSLNLRDHAMPLSVSAKSLVAGTGNLSAILEPGGYPLSIELAGFEEVEEEGTECLRGENSSLLQVFSD